MSLLHDEIAEQPASLLRLLDAEVEATLRVAATLRRRQIAYVLIAARGTSDNAARYAQYLFGALLGLPVALATPSLHSLYGVKLRFEGALVIGISQSGASPDICAVVQDARAAGAPTVAITNVPDSLLGRSAEVVIPLHAGAERSIAATKTYTAQLGALALLGFALADDAAGMALLRTIPDAIAAALATEPRAAEIAAAIVGAESMVTIGRGYSYASAWETALKLKELTYVPTEPYSAADFQHGPIALVRPGFPAIVLAASGPTSPGLAALSRRIAELGGVVAAISDAPEVLDAAALPLALPAGVDERLTPLVQIIPGQLLAFHLARARGHDPDAPRGLRKVTETR